MKARVLLVEDEAAIAMDAAMSLEDLGYEVVGTAVSGAEALEMADSLSPDVVLMDIYLAGDMDGIQAARLIRQKHQTPVIYLTSYSSEIILEKIKSTEPDGYLVKPINYSELKFTIEIALYRSQLKHNALLQQNIINSIPYPFFIIDGHSMEIKISNEASGLKPEQKGIGCSQYITECDGTGAPLAFNCPIRQVIESGRQMSFERRLRLGGGPERHYEVHCFPLFDGSAHHTNIILSLMDITERKKFEKHIIDSQRLESIGRLAGGIAHDFNNLLTAIVGYNEIAMLEVGPEHPAYDKLNLVSMASEKAAALINQLLAFSRKQTLEISPVDIGTAVNEMASLIRRIINDNIRLAIKVPQDLPKVMADKAQIEQIIMNLAVNARDAMERGGDLTIELDTFSADEEFVRGKDLTPGPYVRLRVRDNGTGIDEKVQQSIFEPFFSTKPPGKGTGLGLATVYGIVKQHKGYITLDSRIGKGSVFSVFLPVAPNNPGAQATAAGRTADSLPRGTETILLVDDDKIIREFLASMLKSLGYRIYEAQSGEEALALEPGVLKSLDLLLTDIVMFGMSGHELANRMHNISPALPVLFMSGYGAIGRRKESNMIIKPIRPIELAHAIRAAIDQKERTSPHAGQ